MHQFICDINRPPSNHDAIRYHHPVADDRCARLLPGLEKRDTSPLNASCNPSFSHWAAGHDGASAIWINQALDLRVSKAKNIYIFLF